MRCGVCERSSTGKLVRGIENQLARKKLDSHNMGISDNQYIEKVFTNLRHKLCYVHRRVPNHPPMGQQETAREITNPNPNKRETEMLIICRMWTTSPQTQNHQRQKSNGETQVQKSCGRLVVFDRINLDPNDPNQICCHQKPTL